METMKKKTLLIIQHFNSSSREEHPHIPYTTHTHTHTQHIIFSKTFLMKYIVLFVLIQFPICKGNIATTKVLHRNKIFMIKQATQKNSHTLWK